MTTEELLIIIRTSLQADPALSAWCAAQFSKAVTVYTGIDEDNPPAASNYPLVAIVDVTQHQQNPGNKRIWNIDMGVAVYNESIDETVSNAVTYTGFLQCEKFRELVESALIKARFAKIKFQGSSEKISEYPVFVSYTAAEIEKIITRRNP